MKGLFAVINAPDYLKGIQTRIQQKQERLAAQALQYLTHQSALPATLACISSVGILSKL